MNISILELMRLLYSFVLLINLALPIEGQNQNDLIITSISFEENEVLLEWDGGVPPYTVESSSDLGAWSERTTTNEKSALISFSDLEFFRLKGSYSPIPKGAFYGQLSVGQGEFNEPLEIHRLKSYWKFYLPEGGDTSNIPSQFFKDLILNLQFLDFPETKVIEFEGKLSDLPNARIQTSGQIMKVSWTWGEGTQRRRFALDMNFPYGVNSPRNETIHLSDPSYELTCSYAIDVDEMVFWPELKTEKRKSDSVYLYELPEQEVPKWNNKNIRLSLSGVTIQSSYQLGIPNYRGSLAFIFKTPVLLDWNQTSLSGVTSESILLKDNFSQTYQPGHHNFWEYFIADPHLEPNISQSVLDELVEKDIRYIYYFYSEDSPTRQIAYIGFDGVLRKP